MIIGLSDRRRRQLLALAVALFAGGLPALLAALDCANCGQAIRPGRQYLRQDGRDYCSSRCLEATLPRCAACGQPCVGGFAKDGRRYCSRACVETTLPVCQGCGQRTTRGVLMRDLTWTQRLFCPDCAAGARCFCCDLPATGQPLPDGRHLCRGCAATAVTDQAALLAEADLVRELMRTALGLATDHPIEYALVDEAGLLASSGGTQSGRELGLYRHEATVERMVPRRSWLDLGPPGEAGAERVVEERHLVLVLSHLPRAKLREVLAHELAHDWMRANHPEIAEPAAREGWAELVAALVNERLGQPELNRRMADNPDPDYGGGYRQLREVYLRGGMPALRDRLRELSQEAPRQRR